MSDIGRRAIPSTPEGATRNIWEWLPVGGRIRLMYSGVTKLMVTGVVVDTDQATHVSKHRIVSWCRVLNIKIRQNRTPAEYKRDRIAGAYGLVEVASTEMPRILAELSRAAYGRPDAWEIVRDD